MKRIIYTTIILGLSLTPACLWGAPVIAEFLASNSNGLSDEDGAASDWIEIHNPDSTAVDLLGWRSEALIDARAATIDSAIIAESARWGGLPKQQLPLPSQPLAHRCRRRQIMDDRP